MTPEQHFYHGTLTALSGVFTNYRGTVYFMAHDASCLHVVEHTGTILVTSEAPGTMQAYLVQEFQRRLAGGAA